MCKGLKLKCIPIAVRGPSDTLFGTPKVHFGTIVVGSSWGDGGGGGGEGGGGGAWRVHGGPCWFSQ